MLYFLSNGQPNLIYNGDFELYSSCPTTPSYPTQPVKEIEKCLGWSAPTYGTSDYLNECSPSLVGIPQNTFGEQNAASGEGYAGLYFSNYTGGTGSDGYSGIMWWEYVQGKIVEPLQKDNYYLYSMKISLAEYSDLMINEIGVYFSENVISEPNTSSLKLSPQIIFQKPTFFNDTIEWVTLEGVYIASGNENNLVIGNFKNNEETDTLRRYSNFPDPEPFVCYMFLDDVSLTKTDVVLPNVFTPNSDGINDLWEIHIDNCDLEIFILNRWGNVITRGKVKDFVWNGNDEKGNPMEDGVYFYRIQNSNINGFIQLVR
ncbi:MAG: gliding motility-associated C-terminal domain-containing protein [Bacteroidetes bacterium]|nr:MAG: gliding motility-associated C-terminal domain-containing protein [Bacteroidota bacterium]